MLEYSKFIEDLVKKKRIIDFKTIKVTQNCIAIMTSQMLVKKKDQESFSISCTIRVYKFGRALYDIRASIN